MGGYIYIIPILHVTFKLTLILHIYYCIIVLNKETSFYITNGLYF